MVSGQVPDVTSVIEVLICVFVTLATVARCSEAVLSTIANVASIRLVGAQKVVIDLLVWINSEPLVVIPGHGTVVAIWNLTSVRLSLQITHVHLTFWRLHLVSKLLWLSHVWVSLNWLVVFLSVHLLI